jgi:O-antigen ligase
MTLRIPRDEIWLLGAFGLLAAMTGLLAGIDGRLAIAGALAVAFLLVALADLTIALALFLFLGFVVTNPSFSGSTQDALKLALAIPLVLSWLAVVAREETSQKTFLGVHPAISLVMLMLVSWAALSILWADSGSEVFRSAVRYGLALILVLVAFTAVQTKRDLVIVMAAVVAGAVLAAAYGFLSPPAADPGAQDRFTGTLGDPNYFASAMILGVGLSGGLAAIAKTPLTRGTALGAGVLCLIAIFPTASRGGLLALGAMLIASVFLTKGRRLILTLVILTIALAGIGYVFAAAPQENKDRILHSGNGSGRIDIWTVGGRMVRANPITGVGAGNFEVSSIHYLLQPGSLPNDEFIAETPQVAHNTYLEVVAELGFPGAIMFLSVIFFGLGCSLAALSRFRALRQPEMQALTIAVAVSLIGLLAADVFLSDEYSRPLWLLVGLGPALLALAKRMEPDVAA